MKNKFIRKWLVILTVAAMMIPAGIPANAETVEEGENIAPTAGISAETPNVTAETQKEEISAEMPDMTAETQNEEKSDVQAEGQNQAKQGVLEAVRQNTEKAEEASDAVDVQAEERTAGEVQIGEQIYPTLTEAFAAAKDGDVLRLLENAEVSQPILLTKNVTLDTNGFTVSAAAGFKGNFMFTNRGTFNIVGSGKIDGSVGTYPLIMINNTGGAVLNIQSSEITGQGVVQNVGGIVNITGGTLTASARNTVLSQFGEVHIGASAHLMAAGEGKSAVQLIGAKMTLSGDAVLSGNGGIDVFNSNRNEEGTVSAQVEITGGRIETKDFPVSGNNQESAGAEVAITGGSLKNISGGTAIYWPMEGQLTIGGNAVIEGGTGIEAKMGTITIKDNAVITGSGEWKEEKPQNGGANPEGSAFLGSAQMYAAVQDQGQTAVHIGEDVLCVGGAGFAGQVGRRGRKGTAAGLDDRTGHRVAGHPDADGVQTGAALRRHLRAARHDDGQRAGAERRHEQLCPLRHLADEAGQHLRAGDMDDQGVILRAALGHKDFCHSFPIAGIGCDAVDRLRGQSHQLAAPQQRSRFRDALALGG